MNEIRILADLWPVLLSIVGLISWLVRLQMRVSSVESHTHRVERELNKLIGKHEALDADVVKELAHVREALARIEGALGIKLDRA